MSRTAKGHKRYAELADRLSEQERKIQSQSLAIDHLLAFVPKRAKALPPERLAALGSTVVSLVGSASVQEWAWVREEDVDTRACHRLIVRIDAEGMTTLSILQLEDRLSEALMMEASGAEAPSVSVEVVPLSSDGP